ncbi:hypothetical protein D910_05525 [Dendroctonus ponderosae]|uniref:Bestrophin homolog n=1 Tax=Dendroctonus ponderosae TaxID=77166 RepID=U4U4Y6_DENPD|nr:hypothetical protein D910_05525 [Dendroctonus ponderosae]
MNQYTKEHFVKVVNYCARNGNLIPLSFVLGFFVNIVYSRWWSQFQAIPYPDNVALLIGANIKGQLADRPGLRGGVAIAVRATIPYRRLPSRQSVIENVGVELPDGALIYCGYSTSTRLRATDVDPFFSNTNRVLLMGDFNARHPRFNNPGRKNAAGNFLASYVRDNGQLVMPTSSPTHYPNSGMNPSFLDFGIAKGLANLTEMVVIDTLSSDHLPIYLDIRDLKRIQPNDFRYSYENFDFCEYRKRLQDLSRIPNRIDTVEALELAVKGLAKHIQRTQQALAQKVPNRPRRDNLPEEIMDLIKAKNRIRKRWQRFGQSADRIRAAELA